MATTVENFDAMRIRNASIQPKVGEVTKFGCLGSIEGETEMREITKKCEGTVIKSKSFPIKHTLTLSGYVPVKVYRDIFGLKNDELAVGVYSYSTTSAGATFTLTADVVDDFDNVTKLVAFPNVSSATGLKFTIDNDADEVAYVELEFTAMPDAQRNFYYEAFATEVTEPIKTGWHTKFNYELVKKTL